MTAPITYSEDITGLIECDNDECGNLTHPRFPTCGDCIDDDNIIAGRMNKVRVSTRRNFISGY